MNNNRNFKCAGVKLVGPVQSTGRWSSRGETYKSGCINYPFFAHVRKTYFINIRHNLVETHILTSKRDEYLCGSICHASYTYKI